MRAGVSVATRDLAERLVALEAAETVISEADALATCRVCEKLRRPLSTLAGTAGYASLLMRSLTLAKRQEPALSAVQVNPDGSLHGLHGQAALASVVLVANLLSLLITFIGGTLTMQLLLGVWPALAGYDLISGGKDS